METATMRFPHTPAHAGETYNVFGERITFKAKGAQTGGAATVVELESRPGGGPPLHAHPSAETFTILEGEFEFSGVDAGEPYTIRARPGDTVFIPGNAPHTYKAVAATPSRTMLVLTPGTDMEGFFIEAGVREPDVSGSPPGPTTMQEIIAISQKHGLVFFGP